MGTKAIERSEQAQRADALRPGPPPPARARRRVPAAAAGVLATIGVSNLVGEFGNAVLLAMAINILLVAGLHLLVQWGGQISLAQVSFLGIGALATASLNTAAGWPLPLAAIGGVAATMAASAVIGLPTLRIRRFELAITTLAAGFAVDRWLFRQRWMVSDIGIAQLRERSFLGINIESQHQLVAVAAVAVAILLLLTARIGRSAIGRALRMISSDEAASASFGINVGWHKFIAFVYAGACAGTAGVLYALVHARGMGAQDFPPFVSIVFLSAVLLGGPGSVTGSAIIAAGLAALPILFGAALGAYLGLVSALGLIFVVRVRPGGANEVLAQVAERWRGRRLMPDTTSAPTDGPTL